ncbi:MAG: YicC family protein [Boseongicola sp.]|nr:YicC family protein [Boseongicola sp.]
MTGFGALNGAFADWTFSGDVRSVNGRGLDMRFRAPDWIEGLEPALRKLVQGQVARGSVTVSIRVQRDEAAPALRLNEAQFAATLELLTEIEMGASAHGLALVPTKASDIAAMRGVVEQSDAGAGDTAELKSAILEAFETALEAFDADRAREGAALGSVFAEQLSEVERLRALGVAAAGARADAARSALDRNLARLLEATEVPDEARLMQELALIAVKTDVTEELDRLTAHVAAARALLSAKGPVGRKLDFLMQEFNREANTLCSKAQSTELTAVGLDLKAVIDQMREQVQNIE